MIEVEELGNLVSLVSLDDKVVASDGDCSLSWESGDDVEWSVSVKSAVFIKSLRWFNLLLVKIEDLPSLIESIVSLPDNTVLSFSVSS